MADQLKSLLPMNIITREVIEDQLELLVDLTYDYFFKVFRCYHKDYLKLTSHHQNRIQRSLETQRRDILKTGWRVVLSGDDLQCRNLYITCI